MLSSKLRFIVMRFIKGVAFENELNEFMYLSS